ncbi:hypothetical protein CBM2592_A110112 [Cupriavidus taiwanensis]|nr:hypothetical protein CBM2592_A110112 [Cupriavidus taiwanensis]SOY58923.1 hypothetical protein CBM2588_A80121 [Cupriavidus taiwanensis]SOY80156.1 hypothetical protein CBM2591_A130039 [Cupriavidus taiwanensis]SOZ51001.1 hypothetical protein CBM2617_A110115 [Cupriavidus taiwanensis]SOZ76056.1 hypothetical protein CBM2622_A110110 [Cupriavidus taiwanensis]
MLWLQRMARCYQGKRWGYFQALPSMPKALRSAPGNGVAFLGLIGVNDRPLQLVDVLRTSDSRMESSEWTPSPFAKRGTRTNPA